jgi:hypothetical protein
VFIGLRNLVHRGVQIGFHCFSCSFGVFRELFVACCGVVDSRLHDCDDVFRTGRRRFGYLVNHPEIFRPVWAICATAVWVISTCAAEAIAANSRLNVLVISACAAAVIPVNSRLYVNCLVNGRLCLRTMSSTEESIDVNVPVSTAYNQWTQFEDFPKFMDSVQEVRQLDDTHLHWRAHIAGKEE